MELNTDESLSGRSTPVMRSDILPVIALWCVEQGFQVHFEQMNDMDVINIKPHFCNSVMCVVHRPDSEYVVMETVSENYITRTECHRCEHIDKIKSSIFVFNWVELVYLC
jgi:hypothetical protein